MKSKSIGSLILLAILAPSCGGGGGGGPAAPKNPPLLVKWQTQQRVPTSSHLRAAIFANSVAGIIAGEDGSIFRTDDGGVSWTQQEFTPTNLTSDFSAMSANGKILIAAGADKGTGFGRSYTGIDSAWWKTSSTGNGLVGDYYNSNNFLAASHAERRVDEAPIDFNWVTGPGNRVNISPYTVRWTGKIATPTSATETFTFTASTIAADTVRLVINGTQIFNGTGPSRSGTFSMAPNTKYDLTLEFTHPAAAATTLFLTWSSPSTLLAAVPRTHLYSGAPYTDANAAYPGAGNVAGIYWMLRKDGSLDYDFSGLTGGFSTINLNPAPPPVHVPPSSPIEWQEANGMVFIWDTGYGLICGRDNGWTGGYPADPVAPSAYPAYGGHGPQGQVIRTTDNGNSWLVQTINVANTKTFHRIYVTTTTTGAYHAYLCGEDTGNHGIVLATNPDIADVWRSVDGATMPTTAPPFRAISFPVNDLTGYVAGDGGTIYRITATVTFDPGDPTHLPFPIPPFRVYNYTWTLMNSGTTENLYALSFLDNNVGYAVGDNGTVLKITNAATGLTWTKLSHGDAGINFNAASFTDDGVKGIAVGDAGKIYRTLDGGNNWTPMTISPPNANNLLGAAVPFTGAGTYAFACGAGNTLLRNPDVWNPVPVAWTAATVAGSGGTDTYRAILFPQTEANGVCVGSKGGLGVVLHTTAVDGTTWADVTPASPPNPSYYGLATNLAGNTIYASGGADGKVSVSSDLVGGWALWGNLTTSPGAFTLSSIASPEGSMFKNFVAASNGKVWSMDPAGNWLATSSPWGAAIPQSLAFQGDQSGLTVTNLGSIFTTGDAGVNWFQSFAHTKSVPRAVWMSRTWFGLGYIVANDGVILKTISGGN